MIFKRFAANLRAQNWFAIGIEFAIVVAGVFVGTWVANLNEERRERARTAHMLQELKPQLRLVRDGLAPLPLYYDTTYDYAKTAFAGWRRDPKVSDRDFVIAAYQASQAAYTGVNYASWSQIFGNDRVRDLNDRQLKEDLANLMTFDNAVLEREVFSDYRKDVRKVVPEDIAEQIRARCGDRRNDVGFLTLPKSCALDLPDAKFAAAARDLRANPELVGELRWHLAAVASYIENIQFVRDLADRILKRIDRG